MLLLAYGSAVLAWVLPLWRVRIVLLALLLAFVVALVLGLVLGFVCVCVIGWWGGVGVVGGVLVGVGGWRWDGGWRS